MKITHNSSESSLHSSPGYKIVPTKLELIDDLKTQNEARSGVDSSESRYGLNKRAICMQVRFICCI